MCLTSASQVNIDKLGEITSLKKGSARNRVDDLRNKHGLDVTWTSHKRKADDEGQSKQPRKSKSPSKKSPVKKEAIPMKSDRSGDTDAVGGDNMFEGTIEDVSDIPVEI